MQGGLLNSTPLPCLNPGTAKVKTGCQADGDELSQYEGAVVGDCDCFF